MNIRWIDELVEPGLQEKTLSAAIADSPLAQAVQRLPD
jgi:hypothetical protein